MPYSFTSPGDLPLAPPRNATIPALWDEIKHGGRRHPATKPKPAAENGENAETATRGQLTLLIAHISHHLTPIPGAIDALRAAVQTIWPILFPHEPATPPGAPS